MNTIGTIIVIGGPSGSGESTITNALIEQDDSLIRLVTATTRAPRSGECNEKDYFFFTKDRFLSELSTGNILEHTYIENRDTYYGSYRPELERLLSEGKTVIVNPDIVGARYYKNHYDAITLFIAPESLAILEARILNRTPDIDPKELKNRLENAEKEIREEQPFYDHVIVNRNGHIDEAVEEAAEIINGR